MKSSFLPKYERNILRISAFLPQKFIFTGYLNKLEGAKGHFLGEFEDTKKSFRYYLTLADQFQIINWYLYTNSGAYLGLLNCGC